jgi:threonine/homoserine/homoserine lactone efflux protein
MDPLALFVFAGVYFAAVASPGPGIAAVVARVMGRGLSGAPAFVAGFVVGDLIWFTIAATGLAVIAQTFETLFVVLKYAGAAYLLFLAWRIWTAPVAVIDTDARPANPGTLHPRALHAGAFLGGLTVTLGNPKVIVFFLSIMPIVVDVKAMTPLIYAELGLIIVLVLGPTMMAYVLLAERARRLFRSPRALRNINRGTAAIMAGAATLIATR